MSPRQYKMARMKSVLMLLAVSVAASAQKTEIPALLTMARTPANPAFVPALRDTLTQKAIDSGAAVAGYGPDFLFVTQAPTTPELYIDDVRSGAMQAVPGNPQLWMMQAKLRLGTSHNFYYMVDGKQFGGNHDIAAFTPDSYAKPGAPQGTLSEKMVHTSKLYDGMVSDWWIYVPAQYDAAKPAALMVWHDGQGMINRTVAANSLNVFDNLTAQGKIPVVIQVFIAPGKIGEKAMRSIEYDTVSEKYTRFVDDEIMPLVYAKYNVRRDGYSRAAAGNSSGGISAFNMAWFHPDEFSRVLMRIASFANLQQNHAGEFDGGNTYPYRVRREDKRPIRVWSADGTEDLENPFGSWPSNNINMANSLKFRDYDFHMSWSNGSHNGAHGNAELPEAMTWLWRDYDPAKTSDTFPPDPDEKAKPFFRVKSFNR